MVKINNIVNLYSLGEVLYLAFGKVKLGEREVNLHPQVAYIVGEVLYLALVKLHYISAK